MGIGLSFEGLPFGGLFCLWAWYGCGQAEGLSYGFSNFLSIYYAYKILTRSMFQFFHLSV
ncbi:hypothetical protein CN690_09290 [Bacillus wiedmannii]|nr:hypothetical protein CN690_09290 [Bacillus wiedmannii]PEM32370.1 hypothetical protein CN598_07810 [Bacillus wiedmannii]PHF59911.1 hypothetical protein COI40_13245 [Bacillus wiedmannii]